MALENQSKAAVLVNDLYRKEVLERALMVAARQVVGNEGTWGEARKRLTLIRSWLKAANKELNECRYGAGFGAKTAAVDVAKESH